MRHLDTADAGCSRANHRQRTGCVPAVGRFLLAYPERVQSDAALAAICSGVQVQEDHMAG